MKRAALCLLLVACGDPEQPAPPAGAPPPGVALETVEPPKFADGDTQAALAYARAVFAEPLPSREQWIRSGTDLIEGLIYEDPVRIGRALTSAARALTRATRSEPEPELPPRVPGR